MRTFLSVLAIALLPMLANSAAPIAAPESEPEFETQPARFLCKDGKILAITTVVRQAGVVTFTIPQEACQRDGGRATPRQPPASSSRGI